MNETSGSAPEHQVGFLLSGVGIHPEVEIRRLADGSLWLLNRATGETLTITGTTERPPHFHCCVDSPVCPGCTWERIGPPPVKLSILRGTR